MRQCSPKRLKFLVSPDSAMDCEGMWPFATPLPTTTLSTYPSSTIGAEPEEAVPSPSQSLLQMKTIPSIDCEADGRIASSLCKPKRKRSLLRPIEKGNNKSGRTGKLVCVMCRKRKSKCVYTSEDSPCQSCRDLGKEDSCIKQWGPKKQLRFPRNDSAVATSVLEPTRPVRLYDPEIDPKEVQVLQFAYLHAFELPHQEEYLLRLLKLFSNEDLFGISIKHPTLRFAVCTYSSCFMEHADSFDYLFYYGRAVEALRFKLLNPESIDEGDLFAVALLAMWAGNMCLDTDYIKHVHGFLSLMKHLSRRPDNKLAVFWPMARDEIILHAYDLTSETGDGIVNSVTHTLCRSKHNVGGAAALQEREAYMTALSRPANSATSALGLLETSWQEYFVLRGCLKLAAEYPNGQYRPYILSVLSGVESALSPFDDRKLLAAFENEMAQFKERKGFTRFSFQSNATGILCLLLCRLLLLVLSGLSVDHGLYSLDGIAMATKILLFIHRVDTFGHNSYTSRDADGLDPSWRCPVPYFDPKVLLEWVGQQWPSRENDSEVDRTDTIWWDELVNGIRPWLLKLLPRVQGGGQGIWDNQRHLCGQWER